MLFPLSDTFYFAFYAKCLKNAWETKNAGIKLQQEKPDTVTLEAGMKPLGNHRLLGEMRKAWQGFEWLLEVAQQASVMQT